MAPLGPWVGAGRIAVAVSGGADSLCLAVLARSWAGGKGADTLGLIVDHGLRPDSAAEAALTSRRLDEIGIASRILALRGLAHGSGLAERARAARYAALSAACRQAGIVDLLVGHHAGDQAETVLMRRRARSGPDGLAGMAGLTETADLRIVRPLLGVPPERLRETLRGRGLKWVEDPSNQDERALRTRLRRELADAAAPAGLATGLLAEAADEGVRRLARDGEQARLLAAGVEMRPEGFAILPPALVPVRALAALIRTIGAAAYPPMIEPVASLVRNPRPATLGGARLIRAGRLGPGWLLLREAALVRGPVPAVPDAVWDGRFRLHARACDIPPGAVIGALGPDAAAMRKPSGLPASVLEVLPALRGTDGARLEFRGRFGFEPQLPAAQSPLFLPAATQPLDR